MANHRVTLDKPWNGASEDKRSRIIECAIVLFSQVGFESVTVKDITDALGIARGTFYLYFRNKKDVLLHCFEHMEVFVRQLEDDPLIREGDFFSKIGPRVKGVRQYEWFVGLFTLLRSAELSRDEQIRSKAKSGYEALVLPLKSDLQTAIETGQARHVDAELAVYGFIGLSENLLYRARLDDRYTEEQIVECTIDATMRWLLAGQTASQPTTPDSAQLESVRLVDRDGTELELCDLRFDGNPFVSGRLGRINIDVDVWRLASLSIREVGGHLAARLALVDGSEVELRVGTSTVLSGESRTGKVRVDIQDVSALFFQ